MLLEKKTEPHSNQKYQTANIAAAGYLLSLVGKYGVKSIFQSIKCTESHILVTDFVQNVYDEFCQGYVVARVWAAREETAGGPFMDVALTEQIQMLQDLNFCVFVMYFTYLQKSQFCQKCHDTLALSRRYEMFNKLGQKWLFKKKKKSLPTYLPYYCSARYANINFFFLA